MTHFTDIELHRWRESEAGNDRERIVAHLASCPDCARRYADAIRTRPLRAEPDADVQDFVAAGRRVAGRRRWIAPLAAAAVLVIAIAIPLAMRHQEPQPNELHFRGGGIQALAPQGPIDRNEVQFVWSSAVSAARYRIEVGDAKGVIYTTDADRSPLATSSRLRELLRPGTEYWWTATALDDHGHPLLSSPRRTFTIRTR